LEADLPGSTDPPKRGTFLPGSFWSCDLQLQLSRAILPETTLGLDWQDENNL